jgi:hypothetical protein
VVVHAAGGAGGEDHRQHVVAPVGVGVQEVADGTAFERLLGLRRDRIVGGQEGGHGRPQRLRPGPVRRQRRIGQHGVDGGHQRVEGGGHQKSISLP